MDEHNKPDRGTAPRATENEQQLMNLIAKGDRRAFEEFYLSYASRVARYLGTLLKRPDWVEEAVSDVMLVVWQNAHRYEPRGRLTTWLFGIAHNKALKTLEKHGRQNLVSLESGSDDEEEKMDFADGDATPEQALLSWDDARAVAKALDQLSPDHRAVVQLTFQEDYSYPEIAEIVGCPVNTVKTRMFHARKRLAELLAELAE